MQQVAKPTVPSSGVKYIIFFILTVIIAMLVIITAPFSFAVVGSESMSPMLQKGDILLWQQIEKPDIAIGDIVIFKSYTQWPDEKIIVHRVVNITYDANGNMLLKTGGDANGWIDQQRPNITEPYIRYDHIIGKAMCVGSQPVKISALSMMNAWFM